MLRVKHSLFDERFTEFVEYKEKHGHTIMSGVLAAQAPKELRDWVRTQQRLRWENLMSEERFRKLDSVGFSWLAFVYKQGDFSTASAKSSRRTMESKPSCGEKPFFDFSF